MSNAPLVSMLDVYCRFGPVRALDGVSLHLIAGRVHGIVGENGAGKSTLMKILCGIQAPSSGEIKMRGRAVVLKSPHQARRLGIAMIHQELNLVDDLTVAENIFLGRELTRLGLIWRRRSNAAARAVLQSVQCDVPVTAKVKALSIAQKQMVEIAKAVSQDASVLIMDEPTAVLTRREVEALFQLIGRLKAQGVAVVFVSHILPEILHVCDEVTVMRDGQVVDSLSQAEVRSMGERGLASRMVGRPMADYFPPRLEARGKTVLEVKNLSAPGRVRDVSFTLRRGEILGFAGLIGAGRTELAEAIVGLQKKSKGTVVLDGQVREIRTPRDAVGAGLAYLSEDRKAAGLTLPMSVVQNTTLVSLRRYCRPFIRRRLEERATNRHVHDLSIKLGNIHDPVESLSGGNQQKVALAKWLEINPKILIIDEPTRGVDIGAKEQIYRVIQSLTQSGMAVMLISSELNEVMGMSHRIAVMRNGHLVTMLDAAQASEQAIMQFAAGVVRAA